MNIYIYVKDKNLIQFVRNIKYAKKVFASGILFSLTADSEAVHIHK